jgi:hypothetical protein
VIKQLKLYSRKDCGLCEEMERELQPSLHGLDVTFCIVNIDGDSELQHLYGARIPVLVGDNQEICEVKFDIDALQTFLNSGRDKF